LYDGARDIYSIPERRMQDDDENLSNFTTTGNLLRFLERDGVIGVHDEG
jgi:hypothetical protein